MANEKSGVKKMSEILEEERDKISVDEFIKQITDEQLTKNFRINMNDLFYKKEFSEVWMSIYTKWLELEDRFDTHENKI